MTFGDVDGVCTYLATLQGSKRPPRKTVYAMVRAGMKVARAEGKGSRMFFAMEWVDEFLATQAEKRSAEAGTSARSSHSAMRTTTDGQEYHSAGDHGA